MVLAKAKVCNTERIFWVGNPYYEAIVWYELYTKPKIELISLSCKKRDHCNILTK